MIFVFDPIIHQTSCKYKIIITVILLLLTYYSYYYYYQYYNYYNSFVHSLKIFRCFTVNDSVHRPMGKEKV